MTTLLLTLLLTAELLSIAIIALAGAEHAGVWCAAMACAGIATALSLYLFALKPLRTLVLGTDLLKGQDFGSRLSSVGLSEIDRLVKMFNQMIDSLHRERLAVRETNRYLDLLVASSPMGVINFDINGNLAMANRSALRMLGVKEETDLIGLPARRLPGRLGQLIAALPIGESATLEARPDEGEDNIYRVTKFTFINYGFPRVAVMVEQLTEVVRLTEREAYDKLIRVMAHEINNTMGAVTSTFDLLRDMPEVSTDKDMAALVDSCNHRCRSLSNFVERYAAVARLPKPQLRDTEVNSLIERCGPILSHTAACVCQGARLVIRTDHSLTVRLDPTLMEQVLVNVVKNAAESIARTSGGAGEIKIAVDSEYQMVTVTDDGAGIDKETAAKLFTPFFSTKRQSCSGGTGLTLTADILRNHGFGFSLRTDPTDGLTRFRIKLR
ncbi:MAG: PAS domain-containing protein [Bacteroides sp.]|nr:PAS domain-containing protein [Bacteroides sp.]